MKKLLFIAAACLYGILSHAQSGPTFTNTSESYIPDITATVSYTISGGTMPRSVAYTHTYLSGETYTFPVPGLSFGEYISNTYFQFCCHENTCVSEPKSNIDGQYWHPVGGYSAHVCGGTCNIFTTNTSPDHYDFFWTCPVGG